MKQQLHALIVEDSEDDALLLTRQLEDGGFEVQSERVETAISFVSALESKEWDIILCDYKMPKFDGMKALSIVKERGLDVPFIFVSGTIGEERAIEAMKAGARDYVMKGNPKRLVPAIERELREAKARKERLRAEEKIQFQATLLDQVASAAIVTDLDGTITYWNNSAETLYGWKSGEVLGKKGTDIIVPKHFGSLVRDIRTRIDYTGSWEGEMEFQRKDGTTIPVHVSSSLLRDASGKAAGRLGVSTDITDRKQAEQELVRLRLGIERSTDAIFVTDTLGVIQYVNPAFEQIYGYNSHEAVGQTPRILKSGKNTPSYYEQLWKTLLSRNAFSAEIINKSKDGRLISIEISNNPILDEGDTIIGFMGIHRDITERKHAQEIKEHLEKQLQQAQKLESIGTLASGIAHDFNNILGIILGYSTLLERLREDPQKHSESVEAITKATKRGAALVKQLLIFARKTEARFEVVSINDMIAEITKLLKDTFPKTITISTSLQQDLPSVVADASQIHQVLLNLCVNARDAMPKSGTLSISTKTIEGGAISSRFSTATSRQYVQIEVADTGIGMDETTRQRIFEPFFTTKPPGKGTGLGLAVVYGIIEHHTGFIDVRSAPGEGTSFTVYLPIPERALEEVQVAKKNLAEIPGGTETILVIEDEEMLRELVKASLVSKGYTVLTAEDGMQGVEMYQSHQKEIAVVLSDIGLPLLSGQDVFIGIRKINPEAKVIMASGFIDPETKSQMYRAGLKNFIQKPYMQDEVLQKIRETIDTNA